MKVIVFDFDGVIVDSVCESFLISIDVYNEMGGNLEKSKKNEETYKKARHFVKHDECNYTLFRMIEKNPDIDFDNVMQEEFDAAKGRDSQKAVVFAAKFREHRDKMRQEDLDGWISIHAPYSGVPEAINEISKSHKIFLATARDKRSAELILAKYGIDIKPENIISRDVSTNKGIQLKFICKNFGVEMNNIVFIEDMYEQLKPLKELGIIRAMAEWGYSTEEERRNAEKDGIRLVKKGELLNFVRSLGD